MRFSLFPYIQIHALILLLVLRALAEGKIRWGFWPPDIDISAIREHMPEGEKGNGIWIRPLGDVMDDDWEIESDFESEDGREDKDMRDRESEVEDEEDEEESEEEEGSNVAATSGRFGALLLNEDEDEDAEDESE